jgi:hypothetical protein
MYLPERRKSVRFRGKVPVEFARGTGITRNFSFSGVYFVTDQSFSAGDPIEFFLSLDHTALDHRVHLRCKGEVLRVEPEGERVGVAVAIAAYKLEGLKPHPFSNQQDWQNSGSVRNE